MTTDRSARSLLQTAAREVLTRGATHDAGHLASHLATARASSIFEAKMESVQAISNLDVSDIIAFLQGNDREFQPSQLYMPVDDEKVVDLDKRVSEFRVFTDEALFESAEIIVKQLSERSDTREYVLVRNDLTHIRSYGSRRLLQETSGLPLARDQHGGGAHATPLRHPTRYRIQHRRRRDRDLRRERCTKGVHRDWVTPGSALAFRKDVEHAGMPVVSGESAHAHAQHARAFITFERVAVARARAFFFLSALSLLLAAPIFLFCVL